VDPRTGLDTFSHIGLINLQISKIESHISRNLSIAYKLLSRSLQYSKPSLIRLQLIRMSDKPDLNMKNSIHNLVYTSKDT
jgi:hypothetical protein